MIARKRSEEAEKKYRMLIPSTSDIDVCPPCCFHCVLSPHSHNYPKLNTQVKQSRVQVSPRPEQVRPDPIACRSSAKLIFDEQQASWVFANNGMLNAFFRYSLLFTEDSEDYSLCFNLTMTCNAYREDSDTVANFYLQQHVDHQKEILWSIFGAIS